MKKIAAILSVILALVMCMGLVACTGYVEPTGKAGYDYHNSKTGYGKDIFLK